MKKMRILFATVIMVMLFTFSVSAETESDYTYTVTDGKATITDVNYSISGHVVIPDTLGGCPVTAIGDEAFFDLRCITNVTIPDSVTVIGDYAFQHCIKLKEIAIPSSLRKIGDSAFRDCDSIEKVYITDLAAWCGIDFVTESGWSYQSNPLHTEGPGMGVGLYLNGQLVEDLVIPDGTERIGDYAFLGYQHLKSIKIPASVTFIGKGAFSLCYCLEKITVDENNQYYSNDEYGVLFNKEKTTLIQYPIDSAAYLRLLLEEPETTEEAYELLKGLLGKFKEYRIPDTVTAIGDYAFTSADSLLLTQIIIPDGVTTIGESIFSGSEFIRSLKVPGSLTAHRSLVGDFYGLRHLEFGEGTTSIGCGENDKFHLTRFESVMIPSTVTETGYDAFRGDGELKDVFYAGTQEQWESIVSADDRELLNTNKVNVHFDCCSDTHEYVNAGEEIEGILGDLFFGRKKYECKKCGWYYSVFLYELRDHRMGEWEVQTPATCSKEGIEIRVCDGYEYCGHTETRVIRKLDHSYNKAVTAPTCKGEGYTTYTCSSCGDNHISDFVAKTGHKDTNKDGICDSCGTAVNKTENCSCNCHKGGIQGFIWKILRIFYKLFKTNAVCACGAAHY